MNTNDVLDAIHFALEAHGIEATRNSHSVCLTGHDLRFEASIEDGKQVGDLHQIILAIHIHSDLLNAEPIYECFAGLAATRHQAVGEAFKKFLDGAFHPVIEAFAGYVGDNMRVGIEHWHRADAAWKVFCGPLLYIAWGEVTLPDAYPGFFDKLNDLFTATASPGAHFVRVFFGGANGSATSEVLLNNETWTQGEELLSGHPWPPLEDYQTVRQVIIALPEKLNENRNLAFRAVRSDP